MTEIIVEDGVLTRCEDIIPVQYITARRVVLCTGTYLKAQMYLRRYQQLYRSKRASGGQSSDRFSERALELKCIGLKREHRRELTKDAIDFSKMEEQFGDKRVVPFSFSTDPEEVQIDQVSCWLTYTNEKTHEIIRANLDRSPIVFRYD